MNLKNLNTAEWLAFSRFLTFPIVLLFIFMDCRIIASWLFLIFFSTDLFDGIVARLFNQEGKRRAMLDSWGDILFLVTGLIGFAWFETAFLLDHIGWVMLPLSTYFIEMVYSLIKFKKPTNYHTYLAKFTAFIQVVFFVHMLFFGVNSFVFFVTVLVSTLDPAEDIYITYRLDEWKANINGIWCL